MSTSFNGVIPIIIANGATESNVVGCNAFHDAASIVIFSPASLVENVKIMVHYDPGAGVADAGWCDLVDYLGSGISVPAAGKARWYPELPAMGAIKFVASSAVAAQRTFYMSKNWTV